MKNIQLNIKILIVANIILILVGFLEDGWLGILTVPVLVILNLIVAIAPSAERDEKLKSAALILIFVGPLIGFSICVNVINTSGL